jgi:hypothetical protein
MSCIERKHFFKNKDEFHMNLSAFYKKPLFALGVMGLICTATPLKAMCDKDAGKKSTSVKFAVIGDYGKKCEGTEKVAKLVKGWNPNFIITTGDNNYGGADDLDDNVGYLYSPYIFPYAGQYEQPSVTHNRFWPCLGNHDFQGRHAQAYLNYFNLPGNGYVLPPYNRSRFSFVVD